MAEPISLRTRPDVLPRIAPARVMYEPPRRLGLHVGLFVATFFTAAMSNALLQGENVFLSPGSIAAGVPYAIALMAILLAHELGHYVFARLHRVDATLPFFLPAPPGLFFIGTLGAFIRMRTLPRTNAALFDVGAAGPWGGMLVALPVLFIGLWLSDVQPLAASEGGGLFLGDSLLFRALTWLALGVSSDEVTVVLHPVALAGWVGLLVTALNLMPVGQLDGGHVVYAALGARWHRWISLGTLTALVVLGLGGAFTWLVWAALLSVLGTRHPPILDPYTPLGRGRRWGAAATLLLFLLTFMPEPLWSSPESPRIPRDPDAIPIEAPAGEEVRLLRC